MKVLFATTSTNNVTPFINSLDYLGEHDIQIFRYDEKWNEIAAKAAANNPEVQQMLSAGMWPPPEIYETVRNAVRRDSDLLEHVNDFQPDVVIYISAWEGLFVPHNDTLKQISSDVCPVVHFLCDGADPPWWPQLAVFEKENVFDLTVNIDGSPVWPGGPRWPYKSYEDIGVVKNALTLLTPLDPRSFEGNPIAPHFLERPFGVSYAGNFGGWTRSRLVEHVQKMFPSLAVRQRDNHPASYRLFCDFLRFSRVLISVPFTGSGAAKHVKGRILEGAYAGCCLLEWKNDATRYWFEPRRDMWEYESVEECAEMAAWLSNHPRIAWEMAENLSYKVKRDHSPQKFWGKVFSSLKEK